MTVLMPQRQYKAKYKRSALDAIKDKGIRKRGKGPLIFTDPAICKRIKVAGFADFDSPASTIIVEVGANPKQKCLYIDRELLVCSSKWFKTALSGKWREACGTIVLPEQDVELFEVYTQWLYSGDMYSGKDQALVDTPDHKSWDMEWDRLFQLHYLSVYYQDPGFGNATIDAMLEKFMSTKRFPIGYASQIYEQTFEGSKLRALYVDFHVSLGLCKALMKKSNDEEGAPYEFLLDVINEVANQGHNFSELKGEYCIKFEFPCFNYHEHTDLPQSERCLVLDSEASLAEQMTLLRSEENELDD